MSSAIKITITGIRLGASRMAAIKFLAHDCVPGLGLVMAKAAADRFPKPLSIGVPVEYMKAAEELFDVERAEATGSTSLWPKWGALSMDRQHQLLQYLDDLELLNKESGR